MSKDNIQTIFVNTLFSSHPEKPEFNKLIINTNNIRHGTSVVNYNAPEERITLQIFFK